MNHTNSIKSKKAINFDLSTKRMKRVFGTDKPLAYLKGYKEIRMFMVKNGFAHRQWSGYISNKPLSPYRVTVIMEKMNRELPWLKECINKLDVTNIGDTFDLTHIFKQEQQAEKKIDLKQQTKTAAKAESSQGYRFTLADLKRNAKRVNEQQREKAPTKAKQKNSPSIDD